MFKLLKKTYTLAGFEPGIFCSVGGHVDHYTAPPGLFKLELYWSNPFLEFQLYHCRILSQNRHFFSKYFGENISIKLIPGGGVGLSSGDGEPAVEGYRREGRSEAQPDHQLGRLRQVRLVRRDRMSLRKKRPKCRPIYFASTIHMYLMHMWTGKTITRRPGVSLTQLLRNVNFLSAVFVCFSLEHGVGVCQGCQIFLGTIYPNGEKYTKLTQHYQITIYHMDQKIFPNGHKIYQHFPFKGPLKFTQFRIFFCLKIYHLATLVSAKSKYVFGQRLSVFLQRLSGDMSADIAFAMAAIYFFEENCSLLMS
jgi:hypothetical protein